MTTSETRPDPAWQRWGSDPVAEATGVSFDRTPSGPILAPPGKLRVCAYHIDFDERPTCYVDVATLEEARELCDHLVARCRWNVDYGVAYDERGERVYGGYLPLDAGRSNRAPARAGR